MKDKSNSRKNNRRGRVAGPKPVSPAPKPRAFEPRGADERAQAVNERADAVNERAEAVNERAQARSPVRYGAARGAGGLLQRFGLRGVYGELTLAVRVSIFIAGVWFNDQLIHRLFDAEPPQVVMTMIPGIEWVMMWAILRETLSGAGISPAPRGHPTADASSGVGKS